MTILTLSRWVLDKFTNSQKPKPPALTEIGITEPSCPHCGVTLPKMPSRKITCKACSGTIYSRKRPIDDAKALFRPDQLDEFEEQKAVKYGLWETYQSERAEIEAIKNEIRSDLGYEPSINNVLWRIYHKRLEEAAADSRWFSYQLVHFRLAKLLVSEQRFTPAIRHFLLFVYLGMNGARNSVPDTSGNPRTRCWAVGEEPVISPGIACINQVIMRTSLTEEEVHSIYLDICTTHYKGGHGIPLTPAEAWQEIWPKLFFNHTPKNENAHHIVAQDRY